MDKDTQNSSQTIAVNRWEPAAWLRVRGSDALAFLQGQFTNDLRALARDEAVYGLWLNHKGRVLADSFVLRGLAPDEFWVGSYFSSGAAIRERLEAFIIADDVAVEDQTTRWLGVTLFAADGAEGVPRPTDPAGVFTFPGRRGARALEWVFRRDDAERVRETLGPVQEIENEKVERRRIRAGVPAVPRDIGSGELPNEGGLDVDAISYTKGCYLGQEVMARLKSMGQVRRRLVRVRGTGALPSAPADLFQGGRKAGELRSVVRDGDGFIGLALVSLLHTRNGEPLALSLDGVPTITLAEALP